MLAVMPLSASHLIYRLNDTVQIIKIKEYLLIYANFTSRGIFGYSSSRITNIEIYEHFKNTLRLICH